MNLGYLKQERAKAEAMRHAKDAPPSHLRISHTIPRPLGWGHTTADLARWETMIRLRK